MLNVLTSIFFIITGLVVLVLGVVYVPSAWIIFTGFAGGICVSQGIMNLVGVY